MVDEKENIASTSVTNCNRVIPLATVSMSIMDTVARVALAVANTVMFAMANTVSVIHQLAAANADGTVRTLLSHQSPVPT